MVIIFHTGYHKTASEYLRKKIFSQLHDVLYLDQFYTKNFYRKAFEQAIHKQPKNSSLLISEFADYFLKKIKAKKKDIVVVSSVDLISYHGHNDVELNMVQLLRLFRYLQDNYDEKIEFKVMMTIRNQKSALKSFYSFIRNINLRFNTFSKFIQYGLKNQHEMVFGGYHYDLVLEDMRMLYGSDNVRFFVYEKINKDVKLYLQDILNFIGTKQNIEQLDYTQKVNVNSDTKKGNRIRGVKYNPIANLILKIYRYNEQGFTSFKNTTIFKMARLYVVKSEKIFIKGSLKEIPQELIPDINNMYRNSNERLSQMLGIDLEEYGYIGGRLEVKNDKDI